MKSLVCKFHCMSIRKKLIFSFSLLVIIPVVSSLIFSYHTFKKSKGGKSGETREYGTGSRVNVVKAKGHMA